MQIDHIHFYVEDAAVQRDWFVQRMGWQWLGSAQTADTTSEFLRLGSATIIVSAALTRHSPVATYLEQHPPGVADIGLVVDQLNAVVQRASQRLEPIQTAQCPQSGFLQWARVGGWGSLCHTLIARSSTCSYSTFLLGQGQPSWVPVPAQYPWSPQSSLGEPTIDHVVLNVGAGDLPRAIAFYQHLLGLEVKQSFRIQTQHSGLCSQVLHAAQGNLYFNINAPTSPQSQIQTFIEANNGAGIQHIALRTRNLRQWVAALRQRGVAFLGVPSSYYAQLWQRLQAIAPVPLSLRECQDIEAQQILVDWQPERPEALLLQIFSQPIFKTPTFFLSILSGDSRWQALEKATFWPSTRRLKPSNAKPHSLNIPPVLGSSF